jgi:hypothetical protein
MIKILLVPALLNPAKGYACEAGGEGSAQISELGRLGGPLLGLNCLESRSLNTSGMFTGLYLGPELHSSCYQSPFATYDLVGQYKIQENALQCVDSR